MNYRNLGATGLKISEISLGSWTTYGGSVGATDAARIIHRAFHLGVNLFDTADVYVRGAAEVALGKALKALPREQIVVATKVMGRVWDGPLGAGLSRKHVFDAMDQSLKRLGLDYVDLYQMHAPDPSTPLEETLRAFEDLVRMGKTRYVGFSNFNQKPGLADRLIEIQKRHGYDRFVSSQPRYNLMEPTIEKAHMPFCQQNGIGLIVYSPLMQGVLTNKYAGGKKPKGSRATNPYSFFLDAEKALTPQNIKAAERLAAWAKVRKLGSAAQVALAWVLRRSEISSAITGATSVAQLEHNLAAAKIELSDVDWRDLESAVRGGGKGTSRKGKKKSAPRKSAARETSRKSARAGRASRGKKASKRRR